MQSEAPIKLIALDIDGTLVPEHTNNLSPKLIAALSEAKKQVIVTLVSARAQRDQQIIIDALGLQDGYHVLENGTKVLNPNGEIEYSLYLTAQEVLEIQKTAQPTCDSIGFCVDGNWVQECSSSQLHSVSTMSILIHKDRVDSLVSDINKLQFSHCVTVGNHWSDPSLAVLLMSHKNASKGGGLQYVQQRLGISRDETIAVGDGASDVPMMQHARIAVAMGNAEQKAKSSATEIVSSVQDDGVVEVLEKYILGSENHF